MSVGFRPSGHADERDIARLEEAIGQPISNSFRKFVASFDGSEPDSNVFKVSDKIDSGVNEFIPVSRIVDERSNIENIDSHAYPFAWAEGGNYLILDEGRQGAVFFWDHERPEQEHRIADSFDSFLKMLRPFDPDSVQLAPNQVVSAWINPEFLKKFGR